MAEDYSNVKQVAHGRGYYDGQYPIFKKEPNETAVAEFGKQIAGIVNNMSHAYYEPLQRIFEGVKAGYINPDEALVQGTKGGDLFKKYFGVKPPPPRTDETVQTAHYMNPQDDVQTGGEAPYDPNMPPKQFTAKTGRQVGGFSPANQADLQKFILQEQHANRPVSDQLMAMSGLIKSRAQEELYNPGIRQEIEKIKQSPRRFANFKDLQYKFPNATWAELLQFEKATSGEVTDEEATLGPSKDQLRDTSREGIAADKIKSTEQIAAARNENQMKIAQLRAATYTGTWDQRIKAQKELRLLTNSAADKRQAAKIEHESSIAEGKNYVSLVNHLSHDIGIENAHGVAREMIYGEGDWENIPESIRDSAKASYNKGQQYLDARIGNEQTKGADRQEGLRQGRIRLEQSGMRLEETLRHWASQDEHRRSVDQARMEIRALEVMSHDPNSRATAAINGKKFLESFGVQVDTPQSIFSTLTRMSRALGMKVGFVSPETETPPLNPPRFAPPEKRDIPVVPKPSNTPAGAAKPVDPAVKAFMDKHNPVKKEPTK